MAAIVAVLGLARSSQAGLLAEISQLGTNLLTVSNGQSLTGGPAEHYLGFDGHPSQIYVRTQNTQAATDSVDSVLGAQADPENPTQASVSQPSAALTAQADAAGVFDTLFLGLGAVALLVGAVGVANIMVISVPERRQEIGLRRALGATRGQIRIQFIAEAIMLALAGAAAGVILGVLSTAVYAHIKGWAIVIPPRPGPAAWPRPCSSARSPGCCPPSAPPACHQLRPCGPCHLRPA